MGGGPKNGDGSGSLENLLCWFSEFESEDMLLREGNEGARRDVQRDSGVLAGSRRAEVKGMAERRGDAGGW